jgi:hypothetical protein
MAGGCYTFSGYYTDLVFSVPGSVLTVATNIKNKRNRNFSIMTADHLESGVEPTPEAKYILNMFERTDTF